MHTQGWNETPQRGSKNIPTPYGFQPIGTHWADDFGCLPLCQGDVGPVNWDHHQRAVAANQPASQNPFPAPPYHLGYIPQPPPYHLQSGASNHDYSYEPSLIDEAEDSGMSDWDAGPLTPDAEEQERWEQIVGDGAQDIDESSSGKKKDQVDSVPWEVSARACQTELETINDKVDFVVLAMKKLLGQKQEGQANVSHNDARLEVETDGESSGSQLKRESANEIDARKKLEAMVAEPPQSADCALRGIGFPSSITLFEHYDSNALTRPGDCALDASSNRNDLTPTVATTPCEEEEETSIPGDPHKQLVLSPKQVEGMRETHHINEISSELDIKEEDAKKKAEIRDGPIWKYRIRHPKMVQPRNVDVDKGRIYAKLLAQSDRQTKPWNGDLSNLQAFLLGPFHKCADITGIRNKIFNLFTGIQGVSIELCYVKDEQRLKLFVLVPPFYAETEGARSSFELMEDAEDVSQLLSQQRVDRFDVEIWEANFRLVVV
ncbi:hypothetical protein NXS19_011152 [Fusarium pseudograminearum]|nr:hypothetical protein NXS19_011152 [Fusarium pseudograminearum]